jgi:hypothetical protein
MLPPNGLFGGGGCFKVYEAAGLLRSTCAHRLIDLAATLLVGDWTSAKPFVTLRDIFYEL